MNRLLSRETMPTQGHHLFNLADPPNLIGFTRFATTACSHKVHSWGAAVHERWLPPELANWCSLFPHRSHTSATIRARGCASLYPAARGGTPCVRFSTEGMLKTRGFFPLNLLYVSGDFHTFGPFPERIVLFQVSGTVYDT